MARMQQAQQRLEAAINRLDAALQQRMGAETEHPDVARLSAELASAQASYAELRDVTGAVAGRLDNTIERLNKLLKE